MKFKYVLCCVFTVLALTSCGQTDNNSFNFFTAPSPTNTTTPTLTPTFTHTPSATPSPSATLTPSITLTPSPSLTPKPKIHDIVKINVTNKISNAERCSICYRVDFTFVGENKSSANIKAIEGTLIVSDTFGNFIMRLNTQLTDKILYANDSARWTGLGIDVNRWEDDEWKIYTTDFDYLQFDFIVQKIQYTDGSVISN